MFRKLDVRRKSIVTLALSYDNRKIVVRYFVNRAPGHIQRPRQVDKPQASDERDKTAVNIRRYK